MPVRKPPQGWYRSKIDGTLQRRESSIRAASRSRVISRQRGYVRTGGYYGRYANGGEKKFFDTTRASFTPAIAGTIANLSLNLIPQGVTESDRVGRKCTISKIMIRGELTQNTTSTAADTSSIIRVIVYLDKQTNGATAAVLDILETAVEASFNNLSNSKRFKILSDQRHSLASPSGSGRGTTDTLSYGEMMIPYFWVKKKCNIPIEFSSTTGAIGEVRSNNIGVLVIQSPGAVNNFSYTARVRFTDA